MRRSLRHAARTPHLRVLAWLAWLLLAVTPVYGAPGAMIGDVSHAPTSLTMQMLDHAAHDMAAMAADCCGGHGDGAISSCHCPASCASVLPVLAMVELASALADAIPIPRHGAMAPSVTGSPPLRPPLLQTTRLT